MSGHVCMHVDGRKDGGHDMAAVVVLFQQGINIYLEKVFVQITSPAVGTGIMIKLIGVIKVNM